MVEIPIDVKKINLEKVKNFCLKHNIYYGTVYSESWLKGVTGTPEEVQNVIDYNNNLEKENNYIRKQKSFLYRLFH